MSTEDLSAWSPQKLQAEIERCQRKLIEGNTNLRKYYAAVQRAQRDWIDMADAAGLSGEELECLKADMADDPSRAFPIVDSTIEDRISHDAAALELRLRDILKEVKARK
jgi:hypothetical protein